MKSIRETVQSEWVIHKSRFLGFLAPVRTIEAVLAFVDACRLAHPDATHVCYACVLSSEQTVERASDDGEPQKTAGFPMLELLKKHQMTDVVAVAVRYFGGVKLGAGGLIRAYATTIRQCLEIAILTAPISFDECRIVLEYALFGIIDPYLRQVAEIKEAKFGDHAEYVFECRSDQTSEIAEEIKKRTASDQMVEIVRKSIRFQ